MLYKLLNDDAQSWWYHRQLRERGQAEEARRKERQSILSNVEHLREALANGGYLSTGRGGFTLFMNDGHRLSGYNNEKWLAIAKAVDLPTINTETVPVDKLFALIKLPMVAVGRIPDGFKSLNYASLEYYVSKVRELGAEVTGI